MPKTLTVDEKHSQVAKDSAFVLWFEEVGIADIPLVGGKNASLGEMIQQLTPKGVNVPTGFATTAHAYRYFIEKAGGCRFATLLNRDSGTVFPVNFATVLEQPTNRAPMNCFLWPSSLKFGSNDKCYRKMKL